MLDVFGKGTAYTISAWVRLSVQTDLPSVKDVVTEFPVGAAITGAEVVTEHGQLLAKHFDSVTPGNARKWDATEPSEKTFTYAQADPLVAFAKQHGMAIRGHTLVWHNQTPAWCSRTPTRQRCSPGWRTTSATWPGTTATTSVPGTWSTR